MTRQYSFDIPLKAPKGVKRKLTLTVYRNGLRTPAAAVACLTRHESSDMGTIAQVLHDTEWVIEPMPQTNNKRLMLLMQLAREDVEGKTGPTWRFVTMACEKHKMEVA